MAQPFELTLSDEQTNELQWARDHHRKAYIRTKTAALLKVASGHSIRQVALGGLLKPVRESTIREWIDHYQREGLDGLLVHKGRGRKPAFFPWGLQEVQAVEQVADVVHRSPRLLGVDRSSWTLQTIRSVIGWMSQLTLSAVWQILHRFDLRSKQGRAHVHSPDQLYNEKLEAIERARALALQVPDKVVFLYEDEHTANVRPLVGRSYRFVGEAGEKATGATSQPVRMAGVLDIASGQVLVRQRDSFNVKEMYRFFYHVEQHYPEADVIYMALDNWPIHFHPYVLENLERIHSKIRLLRLPTYAPWTNPIEKFWKKLNREFMKQHGYGLDPQAFEAAVTLWLDKHREESAALLHEVGLLPDDLLAYAN